MKKALNQKPIIHEITEKKVIITHQLINMGKNNQWVLNIPAVLHNNLEIHKPYKITFEKI